MGKDSVQTSYEVQVLQSGNWRIHAQFSKEEREAAIDEARALESMPGVGDIKVVRDDYDTETHLHSEHIVYKYNSPNASTQVSDSERFARLASGGARRGGGGQIPDFETNAGKKRRSGKGSSGFGVLVKLLLVILFGLAMAAVVTGIAAGILPYKKIMGIALYGKMRANVMFVIFVVFFVITVASSFRVFMARDELNAPNLPSRPSLPRRPEPKKKEKQEKRTKKEIDAREERKKREEERRKKEEDRRKKEEDKDESKDLTPEEEEALRREIEEAIRKKAEEDKPPEEGEQPLQEESEEGDEAEPMMSANAEQQKVVMMSFFGESIRKLPAERKKMDNYNRFGVNLYLAGAAEAIGSERHLEAEETEKILSDSLKVMGMAEANADAFAKRYEEYLLSDVRYMQMFQSGRRDMSGYLAGEGDSAIRMDETLEEWNKPKEPENPERQIVVMFTDIVGSTAMTHEKGNMGAQEIVRAHNKVVREALIKFRGKEIKHTGDGIMASFEDVTDSVNATAHMQRLIQMHNQNEPNVPLKVKIGTAMGSVVVEENDLYGVTVQMAARIVDRASEGMNLVSDTVYGMLKGGGMQFIKRGPYLMKGIDGPAYLYEHIWNDKADIAALTAQAETDNAALEQAAAQAEPATHNPEQTDDQPQA
ncbi:MAG: adenylate/guanylate cyclase domain-containing protein [Rhodospirillaceae bacterium]|nr:adenylate/guanylate cyclase domain-containing protein [Rhodospirillaceae bacterium]